MCIMFIDISLSTGNILMTRGIWRVPIDISKGGGKYISWTGSINYVFMVKQVEWSSHLLLQYSINYPGRMDALQLYGDNEKDLGRRDS